MMNHLHQPDVQFGHFPYSQYPTNRPYNRANIPYCRTNIQNQPTTQCVSTTDLVNRKRSIDQCGIVTCGGAPYKHKSGLTQSCLTQSSALQNEYQQSVDSHNEAVANTLDKLYKELNTTTTLLQEAADSITVFMNDVVVG